MDQRETQEQTATEAAADEAKRQTAVASTEAHRQHELRDKLAVEQAAREVIVPRRPVC
jgi:hypothetical protein